MQTVQQALEAALRQGVERLDAELLLLHSLGRSTHDRAWLRAHDTDPISDQQRQGFQQCLGRRATGEPVAYITGGKEFFGMNLLVDRRVLVPRPDTETLVEWALELLPTDSRAAVADLGTGSAAIALAIQQHRPYCAVMAVDASAEALEVAALNAERLSLPIRLRKGHWLSGMADRFDLIVSNPPYIEQDDPHLKHLGHEPAQALSSGPDGLNDIRSIVAQSPAALLDNGWLLLEHGHNQAVQVRDLLRGAGFTKVQSRSDLAGIERCSGGQYQRVK